MTRHDAGVDLRPTGADRLQAMELAGRSAGWVPDPLVNAGPPQPEAVATVPAAVPTAVPTASDLMRGWLQDRLPPWADRIVDRCGPRLVVAAVGVLVVLVIGLLVLRHGSASAAPPSYAASATGPTNATANTGSATDPIGAVLPSSAAATASIVVDVGGRVRKPGLVTLPPGARVADAIRAAGGPLRHREIKVINLAARVSDGQLLLVGVKAAAATGGAAPATGTDGGDPTSADGSSATVGLNSATLDQLVTLPGIGPVLGQKIVDWRAAHGGFTAVSQLQQVSGIGPATYAEISPHVTL